MKRNIQRLGATLSDRMKRTAQGANTITAELGTINQGFSLSVSSLRKAIPRGDYMVDLSLLGLEYDGVEVSRALREGDRVLVIWCGYEPIVVSVVVKS